MKGYIYIKDSLMMHFARFFGNKRMYLKGLYERSTNKKLKLCNPVDFCEKIQWLKLYDHNDLYHQLVDKFEVKKFVSEKLGQNYIIPTLGIYPSFDEIDFNILPNQFVLKTTNGGGNTGVVICRDKSSFDRVQAKKRLEQSMAFDIYKHMGEWAYKGIKPRIIAEEFLSEDGGMELSDYKFFCFNGEPKFCQVIKNRSDKETIDFYDMKWNHQDFIGLNPQATHSRVPIPRPVCFSSMIDVASILSHGFPFSRIDLYEVNSRVYFGEVTFYPNSGFGRFSPDSWNRIMGDLIDIHLIR